MQDRPDKTVLLEAIAGFLATDVVPAVSDRALAFRVRIAAHLLGGVAREAAGEHGRDEAHLDTLLDLLSTPDPVLPADPPALRAAIRAAQTALADRVRTASLDDDELARINAGLRGLLRVRVVVGQPAFDFTDEIP